MNEFLLLVIVIIYLAISYRSASTEARDDQKSHHNERSTYKTHATVKCFSRLFSRQLCEQPSESLDRFVDAQMFERGPDIRRHIRQYYGAQIPLQRCDRRQTIPSCA